MTYKTKQKDIIFDLIKEQEGEFTIKDLYQKLNKKIGLTTIYRYIDNLVLNNILIKNIKDNNTTYCYLKNCQEENHFYLKCDKCGKLTHIDCECISTLTNHILNEHMFIPNKDHIIINGICHNCRKERV